MGVKLLFFLALLLSTAHFQLHATQDWFHHNPVMPEGFKKGVELDTSKKRAVVMLEDSPYARIYGLKPDAFLVANIYHNGKFYVARIPKQGVEKVFFATEPFGGIMAHTMLHFEFSENRPVELIAEIPTAEEAAIRSPGKEIVPILLRDLLFSVEVTVTKGEAAFSPTKGLLHLNGLVYRMISLTGRGTSQYLSGKVKIYESPLNLDDGERARAIEIALRRSHDMGMCHMYNTLLGNCNIHTYRVLRAARPLLEDLDSFLKFSKSLILSLVDEVGVASRVWPSFGKMGLYWRGFIDTSLPKQRLLNSQPRFIELAQAYECEKALQKKMKN